MQKSFSHKKIAHHHILHAALLVFSLSVLIAGTLNSSLALAALDTSGVASLSNQERASNGKPALTANASLNSSAQAKVNDMITNGYFAHIAPSGTPWYSFISATGYQYQYIGENLALTNGGNEDVVQGWMNSTGHRNNLLGITADYTEVGYGVGFANTITDPESGITYQDVWVTAAHYGLPRNCPSGQVGIPPSCSAPAPAPAPTKPSVAQATPPETVEPVEATEPSESTAEEVSTAPDSTEQAADTPNAPLEPTVTIKKQDPSVEKQTRVMIGFGGITSVTSLTSWAFMAIAPHKHRLSAKSTAL